MKRGLVAFVLLAGMLGVAVVMADDRTEPAASSTATEAAATGAAQVSRSLAERQTALLTAEDERLLTLVASQSPARGGAYVQDVDGTATLVLTEGSAYDLQDLVDLGAVQTQDDGSLLLQQDVLVAPGARLRLEAPGTTLRMRSSLDGFTSIVAWKATLEISGAAGAPLTVTSWDPAAGAVDQSPIDGRAYIRDVSGGMRVEHAAFDSLGFWAGRTGGVSWTGSSSDDSSGSITDATFTRNHYGVFASRVDDLEVTDARFSDNAVDGLSLHRGSSGTTVTSSVAQRNGRHGFAADLGSEAVSYTDVTASDNVEAGISFSGAPLADGQTANGASLRIYGGLVVQGGSVERNGGPGIRVVQADQVSVSGTQVIDNRDGILLRDTAAPAEVSGTTVRGQQRYGITVNGGTATVSGNDVSDASTAIRVQDADVTVTGNTVRTAGNHAISVVGSADGSSVTDNRVSGQGPSALDLYRLAEGTDVDLSGNDTTSWVTDRDNYEYWSTFIPNHPMLVLWVALLGVPLVLTLRGRTLRVEPGTAPYRDGRREWAPAQVHPGRHVDREPELVGGGQV